MAKQSKSSKKPEYIKLRGIVEETHVQESFEKLQVNVGLASVDEKVKVIQITSSTQDEGKTTVAVNLAFSYINRGFKVLIVDLDLRRPKIHRNFELPNENGIVDYASGKCAKEALIKHTKYGIDVVFSGNKTPYPAKILESEMIRSLLSEAKEVYDYIILDTPPVSVVVDPILVSKYVDGTLFIVQAEKTKKAIIKESLHTLENAQANVLGLVITSVKEKYTKYNYKYYYSE
ncbi:MAG: CpsD/CapB family tyrosine-protein kinase [Bacilli bacterium]|nr:CpsD/CapB family tyrosine-protein kinase [Bacilli bacterium]